MMEFKMQKILPATSNLKQFEKLMTSKFEYLVLLETHIAQLQPLVRLARQHGKKILLHVDLIQGLRSDEYAVEFLQQTVKPAGLISTRTPVISKAKRKSLIAVQRVFLLDTHALKTSYRLIEQFQPDFIEVLPGVVPHMIREISKQVDVPILAGGLIRTPDEAKEAIEAGAVAVTTSNEQLWDAVG